MDIDEENGFGGGKSSRPPSPPSVPQSPSRPSSQSSNQSSSSIKGKSTMATKRSPKDWLCYLILAGELYDRIFTDKPKGSFLDLFASTVSSAFLGPGFIFTTFTGSLLVSTNVPIVDFPVNVGSYAGLIPHSVGRVLFATVEQNPGFGLLGKEGKDFQVKDADTLEFKANE